MEPNYLLRAQSPQGRSSAATSARNPSGSSAQRIARSLSFHRCLIDFCTQNSVRRAFSSFVGLRQTQTGSEQDVAAKTHCPDVVSVRATAGLCALPDCWCSSTRVRLRGAEHGSAVDSSVASLLLRKHRRPSLRTGGPVTQAPSRVANPLRQKRRGGDDMLHSPSNPLTAIKG